MKLTRKFSEYVDKKYPDWDISIALRYLPIVKDIERKLTKGRVLDVGSGEYGLATYIPKKYKVTGTDVDFGEKRSKKLKIVKASVENLPFKDKAFPVVVCVDMMEHLPAKIREKSIDEMVRVAGKYLYIAFPRGKMSGVIDRYIDKYYFLTHKENLPYLKEHIEYGLPKEEKMVRAIEKSAKKRGRKLKIKTRGNTSLIVWLGLLLVGFSEFRPLTYFYHKLILIFPFLKYLNFFPTYRVIIYSELG